MCATVGFILAVILSSCSHPAHHTVPDSLNQSQLGDVCSVTMLTDINSSQPCKEVRSLLPPMGSCAIRQVLAAPSRDVLFDFLLGNQGSEQTFDSMWRKYQELGERTIHGPIVEIMATRKREYCGFARSATNVQTEGTRVKLTDFIPDSALNPISRNVKLLHIAEPPTPKTKFARSLNLYLLAEGQLTAADAKELTRTLVSQLHLAPYQIAVTMSNHPWFLLDEYFPLRDPLMPSLPISREDAVNNKFITCLSLGDRLSCTGRGGQPAVDLDGK